MNSHYQQFLVVRAIENADAPAFGNGLVISPEVVVVQLFGGGRFERKDLRALRVDTGHHVLDGAVFAGGVHRLKDDQQSISVLRVKNVLIFRQTGGIRVELLAGFILALVLSGVAGIEVFQTNLFLRRHNQRSVFHWSSIKRNNNQISTTTVPNIASYSTKSRSNAFRSHFARFAPASYVL